MAAASTEQIVGPGPRPGAATAPIRRLAVVTLYLSERCNSRCITCDYWRHGSTDMDRTAVTKLLPSLVALQTKTVLISGGEPLLNPEWPEIASLLRSQGMTLWLLTSGLSLAKHVSKVAHLFDRVTVSLDGTDKETYRAIRGLDAFDTVCRGIGMATNAGIAVGLRVTVQRANFRQLPEFVGLAKSLGAREVSFLAADVSNPHAFGRNASFSSDAALYPMDLLILEQTIQCMERDLGSEFERGFIAESPAKLRRILQYYSAVCGLSGYPPVRCNAPEFSAVIEADGRVRPCFFISGPHDAIAASNLETALNGESMAALRANIRAGCHTECTTCVCSAWRDGEPYV